VTPVVANRKTAPAPILPTVAAKKKSKSSLLVDISTESNIQDDLPSGWAYSYGNQTDGSNTILSQTRLNFFGGIQIIQVPFISLMKPRANHNGTNQPTRHHKRVLAVTVVVVVVVILRTIIIKMKRAAAAAAAAKKSKQVLLLL
jgi:mannitol-specific phosphotransferase system IIBC component